MRDATSSEISLFSSTNRGSRMPTKAPHIQDIDLREGIGQQALKDAAGQGMHQGHAQILLV
jgi:hypothetical protein